MVKSEEEKDIKWSFPVSSATYDCACQELDYFNCSQVVKTINTENLTSEERTAIVQLFKIIPDICIEEDANSEMILKVNINTKVLNSEEKHILHVLLSKCETFHVFDFEPAIFDVSSLDNSQRLIIESLSSKATGLNIKASKGELIINKPLEYNKLKENEVKLLKELIKKLKGPKSQIDSSIQLPIIQSKRYEKVCSRERSVEPHDMSQENSDEVIVENGLKTSSCKSGEKSLGKQSSPEEVQKITEAQELNKDDESHKTALEVFEDNETNQTNPDIRSVQFQGTTLEEIRAIEYRKSERAVNDLNDIIDSQKSYIPDENTTSKASSHNKMYKKYFHFNLREKK